MHGNEAKLWQTGDHLSTSKLLIIVTSYSFSWEQVSSLKASFVPKPHPLGTRLSDRVASSHLQETEQHIHDTSRKEVNGCLGPLRVSLPTWVITLLLHHLSNDYIIITYSLCSDYIIITSYPWPSEEGWCKRAAAAGRSGWGHWPSRDE